MRASEIIEDLGAIDDLRGEAEVGAIRFYQNAERDLEIETRRVGEARSGDHRLPGRDAPLSEFDRARKLARITEILQGAGRRIIEIEGWRPSCVIRNPVWEKGETHEEPHGTHPPASGAPVSAKHPICKKGRTPL